jgi:heterogeneous nuclear rnp K-like protein 2
MPESDSNRKRSRSRSPSDSEQPKQHKRANTGAPSHSDEQTTAPTSSNSQLAQTSPSAAANDVNMTDPSQTAATDSATSATADTAKSSIEITNAMAASSNTTSLPGSSSSVTPPSAHIHMRCLIVTQDASIIIGKGGAHVNEIREKSGARVMVSESIPGNPERILNVSGPLDAVSKVSPALADDPILLISLSLSPFLPNRLSGSLSGV